jgi:membrane-associated phospholipid phosphatase
METRQSRIMPFIFISLIYCFFAGLFLYKKILGGYFNETMVVVAALVVIGTIITFFFKISIHSLAMGGLVGIFLVMNRYSGGILLYPCFGLIVATGIVMSSRLVLNAHTLREVIFGLAIGFVIGLMGMEVVPYILALMQY